MRPLCLLLLLPCLSLAQPTLVIPPTVTARHSTWNVGAGVGLSLDGSGFGAASPTGGVPGAAAVALPRVTVLLERRVAGPLFATFTADARYAHHQDDTDADVFLRQLSLAFALGLRGVLNPGGAIEVSILGSVGAGFGSTDGRIAGNGLFGLAPQVLHRQSLSVGATAGLGLERELLEGLALRLSSGVLGVTYGRDVSTSDSPDTQETSHDVSVGLRFSPALELRYAF